MDKLELELDKEASIFLYTKFKNSKNLPTSFLREFCKIENYLYKSCSIKELEELSTRKNLEDE